MSLIEGYRSIVTDLPEAMSLLKENILLNHADEEYTNLSDAGTKK